MKTNRTTTPDSDRRIKTAKIDLLEAIKMLVTAELKKRLNHGAHNTSPTVQQMRGQIDQLQETIDILKGEGNEQEHATD